MTLVARLFRLLAFPHELVHLAVVAPWGSELRVVGSESVGGRGIDTPLATAAARLAPETPTVVVRAVAIAPLVVWLAVAVGVDLVWSPAEASPVTLAVAFLLAFWATPSAGDLSVFLRAEEAIENRALSVGTHVRGTRTAASLATVGIVLFVVTSFVT